MDFLPISLSFGFLLGSVACNPTFQLGQITWVLGNVFDSQASACLREGFDVTTHSVIASSNGWSGTALSAIASGLGFSVSASSIHGLQGCCSQSMWCHETDGCFTHGYGEYYLNPFPLASSQQSTNINLGRPVFSCLEFEEAAAHEAVFLSDVTVSTTGEITVSGDNLGDIREEAAAVSIHGTACANAERCNNICAVCQEDFDCNLGQVCLGTYGNTLRCFTFCGYFGDDDACPCGTVCDSATYAINSGYDVREVFLCTPKEFSSSVNECAGYDNNIECTPTDRTIFAVSSAVNVSVANDASDGDSFDDAFNDRPLTTQNISSGTVDSDVSGCFFDEDCNDGNICTIDSCVSQACSYSLVDEFYTYNGTGLIGCQSHRTHSFRRTAAMFYVQVVQTDGVSSSHADIESILSGEDDYWMSGWDDYPMITEDVSMLSNGGLFLMGHLSPKIAINPNAIIGFVPFPVCKSHYYYASCELFSSNTNMMAMIASDWYPGISSDSNMYHRKSLDSFDILYSNVYEFKDNDLEFPNTFSASLWSDGSFRFRYHSITIQQESLSQINSGVYAATQYYGSYNEEQTVVNTNAVPYFRTDFGNQAGMPQQAAPIIDLLAQPADVTMCSVSAVACPKKSCGLSGEVVEIYWDGIDCDALSDLESTTNGPEEKDYTIHYYCIFAGFHFVPGSLTIDPGNKTTLSCTIPDLETSLASFGTASFVSYSSLLVSLEIFWNVSLANGESVVLDSYGRSGTGAMDEGSNRNPKVVFGLTRVSDQSASLATGAFHWDVLSKATWTPDDGIVVSHDLMFLYGDDTCGCVPFSSAAGTETCDACNVCSGVGDTVDCNGDCLGAAFVDGCDDCVGGLTGEGSCLLENTSPAYTLLPNAGITILIVVISAFVGVLLLCALASRRATQHDGVFADDDDDNNPNRGLLQSEIDRIELVPYQRADDKAIAVAASPNEGIELSFAKNPDGSVGYSSTSPPPATALSSSFPMQSECSVCLTEFEWSEVLRKLPCSHVFHVACIDVWLRNKPLCPLCKQNTRLLLEQQTREEAAAMGESGGVSGWRSYFSSSSSAVQPTTTTGSRAGDAAT